MGLARFVVMLAGVTVLLGCATSVAPSPSAPLATPSAVCLREWDAYLATGSNGVWTTNPDGPMRACGSLREFISGFVARYTGEKPVVGFEGWAEALADSECSSGRFNDTSICKEAGITPTPLPGI